jgi:hypothetical protein
LALIEAGEVGLGVLLQMERATLQGTLGTVARWHGGTVGGLEAGMIVGDGSDPKIQNCLC